MPSIKPSLDGAYVRILRAEEHLNELNLKEPIVSGTQTGFHPDAFGPLTIRDEDVPPLIVGVIIGEIVYNLRAALDYLIYELAFLDSGSIQNNTQFPIEDNATAFQRRKTWNRLPTSSSQGRPGFIQHLSGSHQAAIEKLQPCSGVNWMKVLREISDPDKHRRLSRTKHMVNQKPAFVLRGGKRMEIETEYAFGLCFEGDTTFVTETLESIASEVRKVIDSFKPDF